MNRNSFAVRFRAWLKLVKFSISLPVSLTTATGYFVFHQRFDSGFILPSLGIFLISCGSAALNQYQERNLDLQMERTMKRPLPAGILSPNSALQGITLLIASGLLIILYGGGIVPFLLGVLAILWYNLIYFYLKKMTAYAVVPGSLIGALPPAIGWTSAGGSVFDKSVIILSFFFLMWQIPHFWLLLMKYGKEYEKAGMPSLTKIYSNRQLKRLTLVWLSATAFSSVLFPLFKIIGNSYLSYGFVVVSWFLPVFYLFTQNFQINEQKPSKYFILINVFLIFVVSILTIDSFIN